MIYEFAMERIKISGPGSEIDIAAGARIEPMKI
jgi:hypothetical protein